MKVYETSQMIFIEGASGADFAEKYNAAMQDLKERRIKIDEKQISIEQLRAAILFTETTKIPECIKDKYRLMDIYPVCKDCPHYEPVTKHEGDCPYCNTKRALLRAEMSICDVRWKELEALNNEEENYGH